MSDLQRLPTMLILPNPARLVENVQLRVLGGEHVVHACAQLRRLVRSTFRGAARRGRRGLLGSCRGGFEDRCGVGDGLGLRDADVLGVHDHEGSRGGGSWSWGCWGQRSGGVRGGEGGDVAGSCAPDEGD